MLGGGQSASTLTAPQQPEAGASGISLRGVTKRFGAQTAVRDVDLDIARGEFFTMLGPVRVRARRPCCA